MSHFLRLAWNLPFESPYKHLSYLSLSPVGRPNQFLSVSGEFLVSSDLLRASIVGFPNLMESRSTDIQKDSQEQEQN